jgi:transcriptional regulator with XRE-family HTH domain
MNEKLVGLRKQIGLTQKQMADFLDIDQSYISKIESGERSVPLEVAEKMSLLCGYDPSYFFSDEQIEGLNVSFRANTLDSKDLEAIARVNEIAVNLRFMKKIAEGNRHEK